MGVMGTWCCCADFHDSGNLLCCARLNNHLGRKTKVFGFVVAEAFQILRSHQQVGGLKEGTQIH
jgi:hypothetical protein